MREEFAKGSVDFGKIFDDISTNELWAEIAKRFKIRFGKIQMSIHEGKPAKYANVDIRVCTGSDLEVSTK